MKNCRGIVILSPSLVILSGAKDLGSSLRVNSAKDLLCDESKTQQILRRPDGMNRDSSE